MVQRRVPMRTCVGCRIQRSKKELVRVVRTPEGDVVIDRTGKKAGRGAYLCPQTECLEVARKSKALERALEREISPRVWEELRQGLE
ncbi:MAG: YlxR family protein [Bacillota bacterium]|nr:YlxR family protein [Bacillota bacterium]